VAYRLPGERQPLDLDGPSVEVEPCRAYALWQLGMARYAAVEQAEPGPTQLVALQRLYEYVVPEAQPTWDILDHQGPVPTTVNGMLRLPLDIALPICLGWLATFGQEEQSDSAVDALIPPGKLREALKGDLRLVKAA